MSDEIELISDGSGVAVLGEPASVELFLTSHGLESRALELHRLGGGLGAAAMSLKAGAEISANSGRWLKLTEESARALKHLPPVTNKATGFMHGTLRAPNGQFAKNLQFIPNATSLLNPAMLAGVGSMMAQYALEQSMQEIKEYLAVIDEKVDDILRAQQDAVLADMIGVDLVIDDAMVVRDQVGRVSEITWSKVQGTSMTIARTQAYALRQLDAIAGKLDHKAKIGDLASASKLAASSVQQWLAVLAHTFRLLDAIAVLELDRVLDAAPEELDQHRLGVRAARQNRLDLIFRSTEQLLERMNAAGKTANTKVLLSPGPARAIVASSGQVVTEVLELQRTLDVDDGHESVEAKRWLAAVVEVKDKVVETGTESAENVRQFGTDTLDRAKSTGDRFSSGMRAFREAMQQDRDSELR